MPTQPIRPRAAILLSRALLAMAIALGTVIAVLTPARGTSGGVTYSSDVKVITLG